VASESRIAYFSMEIALHPAVPTYSGGLGMLAGDMIRAAADRELPMVAVTLLHRKGYFYQTLVFGERETADKLLSGHHHVGNGTGGVVLDPAPAAIVEEVAGDPLRACGRVERIGTLTNPTARLPVRSPGGGMARFGTSRVPSALS
jgi:hypothetical protein